jgi:6-phosphogluconolactonase
MSAPARLTVCEDPAAELVRELRAAAAAGGHVALAGGSSPQRAYEAVRGEDWSRTTFWLVDERAVPHDHEDSNYRMIMESLAPPRIERVLTERGAEEAAADYDGRLEGVEIGLMVLGMGPDGHLASLFPGKPELEVRDRRVVAVPEAGMEPHVPRITMTLPMIASARRRVFAVSGEEKRDALLRASELPAGQVDAEWYADRAAAP